MKVKSQHIFIMICAVWIILVMAHPEVQKMMEVMDPLAITVMLGGSLIYPGIGYGIFLIIKKIKNKRKAKTDLEV